MAILTNTQRRNGVLFLLLVAALGVALSFASINGDFEDGLPASAVFLAMRLYLIFIFCRTVIHLMLCLANTLFERKTSAPAHRPLVSILVPCYNEEKVIESAIRSLTQFTYPNIEIIVIDDGSADRTLEVAMRMQRAGRVRLIHQRNGGKAAALNRGISEARGEYFMCMDADSLLSPDCIEQSLRYLQDDPNLAAVAGSVEVGNSKGILPAFQRLEYVSGLNLFKSAQSFLKMVTVIPGPVGIFRKSAVENVGGYRHDNYAEDCELTLRLLTSGYGTLYSPSMIAVTEVPEDMSSLVVQRYRWSRGVLQALNLHRNCLAHPFQSPRNFIIVSYMAIESVVIPVCNFIFAFTALYFALQYSANLLGHFFFQLMFLDFVLALYCALNDASPFSLVVFSILNRFTYGFSIEIIRFLSIIDECIRIPMSWGRLVRKGL